MVDSLSRETRSERMSKVRQRNTDLELILRQGLHRLGFRYRIHPKLPGHPDIVFVRQRLAVFVHGCFWHGHDCRAGRVPTSNVAYWNPKIAANRARDARNVTALEQLGFKVLIVWGCELKQPTHARETIARVEAIVRELNSLDSVQRSS